MNRFMVFCFSIIFISSYGTAATYYKATPVKFLEGIQKSGLDPSYAGQAGGATALYQGTRDRTNLDKNTTWLGTQEKAESYLENVFCPKMVETALIKIDLPNDWAKKMLFI